MKFNMPDGAQLEGTPEEIAAFISAKAYSAARTEQSKEYKTVSCDLCNRKFSNTWNLNMHKGQSHKNVFVAPYKKGETESTKSKMGVSEKLFCKEHNLYYAFATGLARHIRLQHTNKLSVKTYRGGKRRPCAMCQRNFQHPNKNKKTCSRRCFSEYARTQITKRLGTFAMRKVMSDDGMRKIPVILER